MKKTILLSLTFVFTFLFSAFAQIAPSSSNIIYVDKNADGDGSGSSWSDAVPELADALIWARENLSGGTWDSDNPLQIWVASGTYKPLYPTMDSESIPILNAFVLVNNVQVYGGFAGGETTLDDRTNWRANPTILSGELDEPYEEIDTWDNQLYTFTSVCHVVVAAGEIGSAVLDGFTVTGGKAEYWDYRNINGIWMSDDNGGGIYVNDSYPVLRNLIISDNSADASGGGIYIELDENESTQLKLSNVSVMGNRSNGLNSTGIGGGGIHLKGAKLATHNCVLMGNVAARGGAFFAGASSLLLVNTVIAGNQGDLSGGSPYGGGIWLSESSTVEIINTTISANRGASIYKYDSWSTITAVKNSIINNPGVYTNYLSEDKVTNSIVQSITTDNGSNLPSMTNPQFVYGRLATDAPFTNGDYRLKLGSPAIDKGADASYLGDLNGDTDPSGKPRLAGTSIDMGAYEGGYDPLPVRLVSFEAVTEQQTVLLKWTTTREVNSSHFEVQRSTDGSVFSTIGTVQAKGESEEPARYQATDYLPFSGGGLTYYRLKTIDRDGTYELSGIISLKRDQSQDIGLKVYPNPAQEIVTVGLGAEYVGTRVRLVSIAGVVLQEATVKEPVFFIRLDSYPAGVYLLHTADGKVVRVVKE